MSDNKLFADNLKPYAPLAAMAVAVALLIGLFFIMPLRAATNKKLAAMETRTREAVAAAQSAQQGLQKIASLRQDHEGVSKRLRELEERVIGSEESRLALAGELAAARAQLDANKTALNDAVEWTRESMVALEASTREAVARASAAAASSANVSAAPLVGEAPAPPGVPTASLPASAAPGISWRAQRAERSGEPLASLEDYGFKIDLLSCEKKGDKVVCLLNFTSLERDLELNIGDQTRFFNEKGEEFFVSKIRIIDQEKFRFSKVQKWLIQNVVAEVELTFNGASESQNISSLEINTRTENSNGKVYMNWTKIKFRDIPIASS